MKPPGRVPRAAAPRLPLGPACVEAAAVCVALSQMAAEVREYRSQMQAAEAALHAAQDRLDLLLETIMGPAGEPETLAEARAMARLSRLLWGLPDLRAEAAVLESRARTAIARLEDRSGPETA